MPSANEFQRLTAEAKVHKDFLFARGEQWKARAIKAEAEVQRLREHTDEKDAGTLLRLADQTLSLAGTAVRAQYLERQEDMEQHFRNLAVNIKAVSEELRALAARVIPPGTGNRQGRPLGAASGGDPGFWDRLGVGEDGLPVHLPMGVNEHGQGPEDDSAAFTYVCWCGDTECPLTLALGHAWASGTKANQEQE